jgi:hypothetical protein
LIALIIGDNSMIEEKSYVGMGHEVCPVCGTNHTETVLLDRRLRNSLTKDMVTGLSLCEKCNSMTEEYLALVAVSNANSNRTTLRPEEANRTGEIVHIRRTVAAQMFNRELDKNLPMVFVDTEVINHIKKLQANQAAH